MRMKRSAFIKWKVTVFAVKKACSNFTEKTFLFPCFPAVCLAKAGTLFSSLQSIRKDCHICNPFPIRDGGNRLAKSRLKNRFMNGMNVNQVNLFLAIKYGL